MAVHQVIVVRGGGDLATGVIQAFVRAGYPVVVLETHQPTAIRRSVALCEAVYTGFAQVEDISCVRIEGPEELEGCWSRGEVPLLIDPAGELLPRIKPSAVIDSILAKRNLGTHRGMAPVTIGLGPGFTAGEGVDGVIETMRGHDLGRLILEGSALENTGVPGELGGESARRVLHAPCEGNVSHLRQIGDVVAGGEALFTIGEETMVAPFDGLLRGLIREGLTVPAGMKVGDVDPRINVNWKTISDKARCLGGAALSSYLYLSRQKGEGNA